MNSLTSHHTNHKQEAFKLSENKLSWDTLPKEINIFYYVFCFINGWFYNMTTVIGLLKQRNQKKKEKKKIKRRKNKNKNKKSVK